MKSFSGMVILMLFLLAAQFVRAQGTAMSVQEVNAMSDTEVLLRAIESVPPAPATAAPQGATFYSALHAPGSLSPWPPLPGNIYGLPVWDLGDGVYLLDDVEDNDSLTTSSRLMPMVGGGGGGLVPPGFSGGGGGTNVFYSDSFNPPVYTTNDLWLSMKGVTNAAAYMTIHPPWTVTNGVWDLYYTTDLAAPETWTWVMRSFAEETNLVAGNATDAQGFYKLGPPDDLASVSSLGTNFWLAFCTLNPYDYSQQWLNREQWLYISSPVGASGVVTIPGLGITNTFTVAAGTVTNISITTNAMLGGYRFEWGAYGFYDYPDGVVESNGIHITASQPVSVYALYYQLAAGAAFTCYPTPLLGTNYCLMAYSANAYPAYSQFAIVATEDNTTVHVNPSATAGLVKYVDDQDNGYAYTVTNLQQGQTYEIESGNYVDDVTGTQIQSDKPIAVFAGADVAYVPADGGPLAENPLVQEQLPVESWGTMALALSFAGRTNGDTYRVLAAYSNTVVTITGTIVTPPESKDVSPWPVTKTNETMVVTNLVGLPYDIIVEGPVVFQASQPIQVAHFANGTFYDHIALPPYEGDPCEILLPPVGHYFVTNTVFTPLYNTNSTGDFDENFLTIIVPQSVMANTLLDGAIVATNNFVPIGTSGYYGARLPVASGTHKVTSSLPVGVEVYGLGGPLGSDAYGYFGGVVK